MIKNHLGQPVHKGCYSWNFCNDENNQLSTIREALYEAWKQGFRKINFFLKSNQGVKLIQTHRLTSLIQTHRLTSLENVLIMDDIATLKKMIKQIHIQVGPQVVSEKFKD